MYFILGGKNQGKLNWYLTRNHATIEDVADGETMALDVLPEQAVINHLHRWIFRMVQNNLDPVPLLEQYLQKYPDAVILCDEIGCGVVTRQSGNGARSPDAFAANWQKKPSGSTASSAD